MFKKLVSKLNRGQEIGTVQIGIACIANSKIVWKRGGRFQVGDEELADTLKEELTKAGYQVVGDPNSLFEDPQEWKAEFLLAGIIKHVALNQCFPYAGFGNFTTSSGEASVEVEWQIFERRTRSVVFTSSTGGTADADQGPAGGEQAYYSAFAASVRNLLADQRFASIMSKQPPTVVQGREALLVETVYLDKVDPSKSSEVIQYVHGSVVTIPVGSGHGSGVIISRSGMVLTNAHVVGEGTGMVSVELATGRRIIGEVVRVNKEIDAAIIQLEKGRYLPAPMGSPDSMKIGDPVFAIGTPLDQRLSRTVTKGVVSAFREEDGRRLIQSDVTIHPGNSGGPLLDGNGRVIGIAHSAFLAGRTGIGLNYFVPIDEAWKALQVQPQNAKVDLAGLLGGSDAGQPGVGSSRTAGPSKKESEIAEKLQIIKGLREKGLISQEEADHRTKEFLDQMLK